MQVLHAVYRVSVDIPEARTQGIDNITRVIHSFRPAFSESLFQYNNSLSEQLLKTFSNYPAVYSADLIDDDDLILQSWVSSYSDVNSIPFVITTELQYGSRVIGLLKVTLDLTPIISAAEIDIGQNIWFSSLMGLISLILLYFIAQNQVTQPISRLSDVVAKIDTNKLEMIEIEKLEEVTAYAELEELRQSLKAILIELANNLSENKKSHNLLQEFAAGLENEVRKRTGELIISKEKAEHANQAKTDFMNTMTHELRTPLNSIIGFSTILKGQELPDRLARLVQNIHESGEQLLGLITDMIDYVDLETKPLNTHMFSVLDVTNAAYFEHKKMAEDNQLIFRHAVNESLVLRGDPKRLSMAIRHIVNNAIKFTEAGVVEIEAQAMESGGVCITVTDSGPGIDLARIQELSVSFVQQEQGLNRSKEGLGLGLAIVERVCRKWGAELTFSHADPHGTIVTLKLQSIE
jgi:signal transduction histidine kinase